MAFSDQAKQYAAIVLENRRLLSSLETQKRRAEVFEKIPALRDIETTITSLGLSLVRTVLAHEQDEALTDSVNIEIESLRHKQRHILQQKGYTEQYLDPFHVCGTCQDTGLTQNGETCVCAKQLLREHAMQEINRVSPLELCDFGTFSLHYYATTADPEYGMSARENMKQNLDACVSFAKKFPAGTNNLLMLGDAGLGKTHLALSIAKMILQRGFDVVYCSAANIFKQIEIEHFENKRDMTTLDSLKRCDLLVLDDLGAEFISPFANSILYDIVNTRILQKKPTIYTSNITKKEVLTMRYGEKITSRLVGCSTVLSFFGDDIRIQKSNEDA